jgi:hypothetical protein
MPGGLFMEISSSSSHLVELPCLRSIQLSVHAAPGLLETNGATGVISVIDSWHGAVLSHILCRKPVEAVEEKHHTLRP